jgi:hypothetical protein
MTTCSSNTFIGFNGTGAAESQLHLVEGSTQFPSNPHWQRWTPVLPPAQNVLAFPFLSFHHAYVMVLSSSGAKLQSYYLMNCYRLIKFTNLKNNEQKWRITLID